MCRISERCHFSASSKYTYHRLGYSVSCSVYTPIPRVKLLSKCILLAVECRKKKQQYVKGDEKKKIFFAKYDFTLANKVEWHVYRNIIYGSLASTLAFAIIFDDLIGSHGILRYGMKYNYTLGSIRSIYWMSFEPWKYSTSAGLFAHYFHCKFDAGNLKWIVMRTHIRSRSAIPDNVEKYS